MLIIGVVAIFKESIAVTGKSELRRPKIRTFGIATVVITIIAMVTDGLMDGIVPEVMFWLGIVIPTAMAIGLKEVKEHQQ